MLIEARSAPDGRLVHVNVLGLVEQAFDLAHRRVDLRGLGALRVLDRDVEVLLLGLRHEAGADERHERDRADEQRDGDADDGERWSSAPPQ